MSRASLLKKIEPGDRLLLDTTVLAAYFDADDETHPLAASSRISSRPGGIPQSSR